MSSPSFSRVFSEVASPLQSKVAAIIGIFLLAVIAGIAIAWARVWWKSRRKQPPNV